MLKFPLIDQIPPELNGLLYDFWWDLDKLLSLDLPFTSVSTEKLSWHLDLPWWQIDGKPFSLRPRDVLENPKKYPEQYKRALGSSLTFPVTVRHDVERVIIIDGIHRLLKAVILKVPSLECRIFDESQIPQILFEDTDK